jgi:FtsP/CotA-like multicopper oxidase with cupredoxin domain
MRLASGLGAAALLPVGRRGTAAEPDPVRLTPAAGRAPLVGDGQPDTAVWSYNGSVPGPVLRFRQGEPVRVVLENRLEEDTTIHWHGIRLPNAMDGVPGLTQPPVRPEESFTYAFTPPDAGTFWYDPHADGLVQMGRGLAGGLIIEGKEPPKVDRELVWVIQDWRLTEDAGIAGGFGNRMEAAMAGRIGDTVTINGRVPDALQVRAGERIRLRLVNASLARLMALSFGGHHPIVIALDGQPCEPHKPAGGHLLLGPAMRADVILDWWASPAATMR